MLALCGRASEVDVFPFFLAEKLGKTLSEIEGLSHAETVRWAAYYEAKAACENLTEVTI